ncbi:hypothetical protein BTO15_03650 [Polaribacter sejongensis]|uniref:Lipocalin-like domain-containing protein n=1 Tax=Polaribacter sejongensis TaxID=985043 RepID=A0ABM6PX21_9FLAO|nr:hypothetical protein [Polaribacter sejongensis]AUC21255.1 hypothetical protein BTO15_03650 [Polaribacter sejongensis]
MKTKSYFFILLFGILFASCTPELSTKEFMVDNWETTYLKIEMYTVNNTDSLQVYEDKFDDNPELVAQSQYNNDGTFSAWFKNTKGEQISKAIGEWDVVEDSLKVAFNYGGKDKKVSYFIERTTEGFIGTSKYDWDEDGKFDDLLTMKTKRIKLD